MSKVDPWHWESTLVGEDPTVDTIFVEGASHCEWMHAIKPGTSGGNPLEEPWGSEYVCYCMFDSVCTDVCNLDEESR